MYKSIVFTIVVATLGFVGMAKVSADQNILEIGKIIKTNALQCPKGTVLVHCVVTDTCCAKGGYCGPDDAPVCNEWVENNNTTNQDSGN